MTKRTAAMGFPRESVTAAHAGPAPAASVTAHPAANTRRQSLTTDAAPSKRVPHTEFDRVGLLVFVARERQIGAIGNPLADRQPRRRTDARRAVRVEEGGRELERIHADRLLQDL